MLASMLVARVLGRESFGELGMIQNTVGLFGVLAGFGLGLTATKYVAECRVTDTEKAGRILALSSAAATILGGISALALYFAAPFLAKNTLAAPHLTEPLRIASLLLLVSAHNGQQNGALAGLESFRLLTTVNIWAGLLSFPILWLSAVYGGLHGAVWGVVISQAVTWLLTRHALMREAARNKLAFLWSSASSELGVLWSFSFPAFLGGVAVVPANWLCSTMLVNQPHGYTEMGLFNAANQWFAALMVLPAVIGQACLPILAERLGAADTRRVGKVLLSAMLVSAAVLMPIALAGSLLSPWIMGFYGPEFVHGWPTLACCLATALLLGVQTPVGQVLIALGRLWLGLFMNLGWSVVIVAGTYLLVDRGALGLAGARLVAYGFHALWTIGFAAWFILRKSHPIPSPNIPIAAGA